MFAFLRIDRPTNATLRPQSTATSHACCMRCTLDANDEMAPAYELLKVQTNPIPIKAAMNLLGHELGGYRLPMVEPTDEELARVRDCLERAGVLSTARA